MRNIIVFLLVLSMFSITVEIVQAENGQYDMSLRKGEARPTLDPAQFSDTTIRRAYEVAGEIPWVLDSIYCYCQCKENPYFKHKSLLSCYVDNHAAG